MEAQQQPGPLVDALGVHDASGAELGKPAASPGPDIAALLSPAAGSGSGHRRSFSRQGSGLSRLISKNWESDLQVGRPAAVHTADRTNNHTPAAAPGPAAKCARCPARTPPAHQPRPTLL